MMPFEDCCHCVLRLRGILMGQEGVHISRHGTPIGIDDQILAIVVYKLLVMLTDDFSGSLRQLPTIPIDDLGCLQGEVLCDVLDLLVCHMGVPVLDTRPVPDTIPRHDTPEHHVMHLKL